MESWLMSRFLPAVVENFNKDEPVILIPFDHPQLVVSYIRTQPINIQVRMIKGLSPEQQSSIVSHAC